MATDKKVFSAEEILASLQSKVQTQDETLEKLSEAMGSIEGRISAVELKPEAKGELAAKYKSNLNTKTIVIAVAATATVAGAGYMGYRMLSKKEQEVPEAEVLSLSGQRTVPMSQNKVDAIRQSLAK